jgi:hypothetical protein
MQFGALAGVAFAEGFIVRQPVVLPGLFRPDREQAQSGRPDREQAQSGRPDREQAQSGRPDGEHSRSGGRDAS